MQRGDRAGAGTEIWRGVLVHATAAAGQGREEGKHTSSLVHQMTMLTKACGVCPVVQGHKHWVLAVSWSPDGRYIATGDMDGVLWLWDPDGKPLGTCKGHTKYVTSLVSGCLWDWHQYTSCGYVSVVLLGAMPQVCCIASCPTLLLCCAVGVGAGSQGTPQRAVCQRQQRLHHSGLGCPQPPLLIHHEQPHRHHQLCALGR